MNPRKNNIEASDDSKPKGDWSDEDEELLLQFPSPVLEVEENSEPSDATTFRIEGSPGATDESDSKAPPGKNTE